MKFSLSHVIPAGPASAKAFIISTIQKEDLIVVKFVIERSLMYLFCLKVCPFLFLQNQ